jgi:hypothetical protein
MAQYRQFNTSVFISDANLVVTTTLANGLQLSDVVVRDGSENTNFATVMNAHKAAALGSNPSAISPPCYVTTAGKWIRGQAAGTITTAATKINVPTGNSGNLILNFDAGSFTLKRIKNGGSATAFSSGDTLNVADQDTLAFQVTGLAEQDVVNGEVVDSDTKSQLDTISIVNTSPAP